IFMKRMSEATTIQNVEKFFDPDQQVVEKMFEEEIPDLPDNVMIYEIYGPLFFGASQKFQDFLTDLRQEPELLIIRMRHVPLIDAAGSGPFQEFERKLSAAGTTMLISGANQQVRTDLLNAELSPPLEEQNILDSIDLAIERGKAVVKNEN